MRALRRVFCAILAAAAAAGCASSTEPESGIISAQVESEVVYPGAGFSLTASRAQRGSWYVNRCHWYLQRLEAGGWVRASRPQSPCEGSWVEVDEGRPARIELRIPAGAEHGDHRIELVVSPFNYDAGPIVSFAPLEEATVVSNTFWIPAFR